MYLLLNVDIVFLKFIWVQKLDCNFLFAVCPYQFPNSKKPAKTLSKTLHYLPLKLLSLHYLFSPNGKLPVRSVKFNH